jgi:hypothetical protein
LYIHYNNSGGDTLTNHPEKENIKQITKTINDNFSKMTSEEKKNKYGKSGEKNGMFGKTHSEEARKNISEKNKGKTPKNLGNPCSDETKKKISEFAKTRTGNKNSFYKKGFNCFLVTINYYSFIKNKKN